MIRIKNFPCLSTHHNILPSLYLQRFFASEKVEDKSVVNDILEDIRKTTLTEEEILRKRFQARIPERVYRTFILKEPMPIEAKYELEMKRLRIYYARFGSESKLNPGLCWPTKEEVLETMKYDKMFELTLQDRIKKVEAKRLAEEESKRAVEAEVEKNLANLDKWLSDYYAKLDKKKEKAQELKVERERLVEEISEYLGYDIDPRDPRFKEAVEQKNKEKKKAMKVQKQKESYDKMLEKLKKIAQNK